MPDRIEPPDGSIAASAYPSCKASRAFLCSGLVSEVGFGGSGTIEGGSAVSVVDSGFGSSNTFGTNFAEVGAFWEVEAEEAIGVLDGTLLTGGVGVSVVQSAVDNRLNLGDVEELAAVVGEEAFHFNDAA